MKGEQKRGLETRFPWLNRVREATQGVSKDALHLVGVSGGADSRVLLHILPIVGFRNLVVCHLDHGLRGAESVEDRKFVNRLAHRLGFACYIGTVTGLPDVGPIETAAREARLRFFAEAAERFSTESLFLAHHADDRVETFLINLFRGTGSFENAAIKPQSQLHVGGSSLLIRRPLIDVWKDEIYGFAAALRLKYREDSTNVSLQMVRNRVRHELIPEIEKIMGRPLKRTLLRTIEIAANEGEFLKSLVPETAKKPALETRELKNLPVPIQRRTIYAWLRHQRIKDYGFDEIEAVRSLLNQVEIAKVNLPRGFFCRRRSGKLFLSAPARSDPSGLPE
ncbi:MAG TPA: tRNA lysidine(34) synthetase TilS [Chthoniobacterales bacterium]|nr:tRNA lysidine(34) synthetase TilS [Chthoniobacterales bacterium]